MVSNDIVEVSSDFGEAPSDLNEATTIHDVFITKSKDMQKWTKILKNAPKLAKYDPQMDQKCSQVGQKTIAQQTLSIDNPHNMST